VSKQTLNKYVGVYSNTELALNVTISQQDTILFIRQSGQATKNRLYSTKTDEFEIPADQITIVFNTLKNEMILNQSGQSYSFQKNK
jgi:cellobiose phosphorylase